MPRCTVQFFDSSVTFLTGMIWNTITPEKGNPNGPDLGFRAYAKAACDASNSIAWASYTGEDKSIDGFLDYAYDGAVLNDAYGANASGTMGGGLNPPSCAGRDPGIYLWRDFDSYGWNNTTQHYHGHVVVCPFVCEQIAVSPIRRQSVGERLFRSTRGMSASIC